MKILVMCYTLVCDSLRRRGTHSRKQKKERTVRDIIGLSVRKVFCYSQHPTSGWIDTHGHLSCFHQQEGQRAAIERRPENIPTVTRMSR